MNITHCMHNQPKFFFYDLLNSEVIKKRRSKSIGEKMVNFAEDREVKEDHVRGNQKVVCTITSEPSGKRNKVCHLSSGNFAISIYYCL